jgi:hypothetical protein
MGTQKIKIKCKIAAQANKSQMACSGSMGSSSKIWSSCFQVSSAGSLKRK